MCGGTSTSISVLLSTLVVVRTSPMRTIVCSSKLSPVKTTVTLPCVGPRAGVTTMSFGGVGTRS